MATYGFKDRGYGMASRGDNFLDGEFLLEIHKINGYDITQCNNLRKRQVLQFLVPIFSLNKPIWVTKKVANALFEAMSKETLVDQGAFITNKVQNAVLEAWDVKSKPLALSLLLYPLYQHHKCLTEDEFASWQLQQRIPAR